MRTIKEQVDAYSLATEHDPNHKTNASYNHTVQDKDNDVAPTRPATAASNPSKTNLTHEPKRWISLDPSISVRAGRDPPEEIKYRSKVDACPSFRVQKDPPGLKGLTIPVSHTPIVDRLEAISRSRIIIDPEFDTSAMDRLEPVRKNDSSSKC